MQISMKKRLLSALLAFIMVFTYMPAMAFATDNVNAGSGTAIAAEENLEEFSVLDGQLTIHNSAKQGTVKDGVVTITAPGTVVGTPSPNVVTIYNETGSDIILEFDYTASNYSSFNLNSDNGTYSKVVAAGGYATLSITAAENGTAAVLNLNNFSIKEVSEISELTFSYDASLGSVTVAGESIASGDSRTVTYQDGAEVTAEPLEGVRFLGWINKDTGKIYSREESFNLKPTESAPVEAVFIHEASPAYYLAGEKYITSDFETAMNMASTTSNKVVSILNDAVLEAGDYTVPAGVTLLVPFDDKNTLYTKTPRATAEAYVTPTPYRTLTLEAGANLDIHGAMSVSAVHYAAESPKRGSGAPTGNIGFVELENGSSITVNDGAALYAYGYVTGEGTVTAKSGATVYENFQIEDFRGGSATSEMATTYVDYGVLPVSQYYVQNIEAPLTLEAGAAEYTYTSIYMADGIYGTSIAFISENNAMFNLTEGSVTKYYDGSTDRLVVVANGTMGLSPITVNLNDNVVDSSSFVLPINSNITVKINSGAVNIKQDVALLPGSEMIIEEGAECILYDEAKLYVYDAEQWGNYCGAVNKPLLPVIYAPGRTYTRTESDLTDATILVNGTLDAEEGFVYTTTNEMYDIGYGNIYSTKNGVIKSIIGFEDCTYQFVQSGKTGTFDEIKLLPANLKNADESFLLTMDDGEAGTYTYVDGMWTCDHSATEVIDKAATCVEAGSKTVTCEMDHVFKVVIPATGKHEMVYTDEKPATCTQPGSASSGYCKNCSYAEEAGEIPALGHAYEWKTTATATCTTDGSKTGVCTRCDDEKTEVIPSKGHTEKTVNQAATCTSTGIEGKVICTVCGETIQPGNVVDILDHNWDKGKVSKEPTVDAEGEMTYTCTACGATKTEVIPKETERTVKDYSTFIELLGILEELAYEYTFTDNGMGKDPAMLLIKYVRTGVDRYNSGSWQIMAGYEDAGFAEYVSNWEAKTNAAIASEEDKIYVTSLKNLENMYLPNGDYVDLGHMFGTMDISYTNINSMNHADVSGWAGDTTDLLTTVDSFGCTGELEDLVDKITNEYFLIELNKDDKFSSTDMLGDMDGYYFIEQLKANTYEKGLLTELMENYFVEELSEAQRAEFFLDNRLKCGSTRDAVREAVYNAYTSNAMIETLEETREFQSDDDTLALLRRACCYAVADYFCKLAGDFVDMKDNPYYSVDSARYSTLAPGITQEIKLATTADNRNFVYYIATADVTRDDVNVYANYGSRPIEKNADGSYAWTEESVLDQANDAQAKYGDPDSADYIENYQVVTSINADGFAMLTTGEPSGLHIMDGVVYKGIDNDGFFGILKDGTAVIGTKDEYNNIYKGQVAEAVGGFGSTLIKDGKACISGTSDYYTNRTARTAVGVTKTGKVVFLVLDGRQQASIGGSMAEIAQIMLEAGCVDAINLDGAGSTTYVAKPEGADELEVINEPSDGEPRKVGNTLMMVSTAPSSTAFDHAVLESETSHMTIGSTMEITAKGVSATGDSAELPEGATWAVSNGRASISEKGVVTALRSGTFDVQLKLNDTIIGQKTISAVVPDRVTFTKSSVNVVYGSSVTLPVKAYYQGKPVTVNPSDFEYTFGNENVGCMDGFDFCAAEGTDIRNTKVTFTVKNTDVSGTITVYIYNQGDMTFDFDLATGGERTFAWDRKVSNSETDDNKTYNVVDENKDMTTAYTFAIDMTKIPIPKELEDLTVQLPGADQEGACAWTFLCNLAQRMSDLTEVKATVVFDENVEVDYENVKVVNDYFALTKKEFDEETNTLVLTLNWIRQKSAIDINEANPICILNGLKVTPKEDAPWDARNSLSFVNSGSISYTAYMKASSLYTFASDPANQERYKLYPYENDYIMDDGDKDRGGYFGSTYVQFSDTYTLVNAHKNGWVAENGGQSYYEDGEKLTGICKVPVSETESYYYDFGEDGIVAGKDAKYTGMIANEDGSYYYAKDGVLLSGWVRIGDDYYYFAEDTKKNLVGEHEITVTALSHHQTDDGLLEITNTVKFNFDKTGKVSETFHTSEDGTTYYYYGPGFYCRKWIEIDGKTYHFGYKGEMYKGLRSYRTLIKEPKVYYIFDEETGALIQECKGFVEYKGSTYYYVPKEDLLNNTYEESEMYNGRLKGLRKIDGKYYLFSSKTGAMLSGKRDISAYNDSGCDYLTFDKAKGYAVDANGNPVTSLEHKYSSSYTVDKKATAKVNGSKSKHCIHSGCTGKTSVTAIPRIYTMTLSASKYTYNGYAKKPTVTVKDSKKKTLKQGTDYTVSYKNNVKAGTATVTITGKGNYYTGTKSKTFTIAKAKMTGIKATGKTTTYNGKKHTITLKGVPRGAKVYYKTSSKGKYTTKKPTRVSVGATTVYYLVKKDNYNDVKGSAKIVVNPKPTKITSLSRGKKSFTVKWSKKTTQTTGYQVYYTKYKTRVKGKTVTIGKAKTTSKKISSLKSGSRYYVWVRTYKTVKGKKYYSAWSARKSVVTK